MSTFRRLFGPRSPMGPVLGVILVCLGASRADGQTPPGPGIRAAGLSEAFVAVADDASAVYWNPAGLATGGVFSSIFERLYDEAEAGDVAARQFENRMIAVGVPSFGATYYRLSRQQALGPPPVSPDGDPEALLPAEGVVLVTDNYGATLVQSLIEELVVGTTLRYVRGKVGRPALPPGQAPADVVDDLETTGSTQSEFDLDVGVMASVGTFRVGYVGRNLVQPEFEMAGHEPVRVHQQHRVGVAFLPSDQWVIAADADVTKTTDDFGERQPVSFGVEYWLMQKRVGVRGGFMVNAQNSDQRSASIGGSVRLGNRFYAEGFYRTSDHDRVSAWGVGGRVGY